MRRRRTPLLLTLLLIAGLGGAALALAAPATGDRIRTSLPEPDARTPRAGTVEFVGQDRSGSYNVAVVRSRTGAVLAYVRNGTSLGRWLTGTVEDGVAVLSGPKGATLRAVFRTARVTGSARVGGRRITFTLPRAIRGSGLRRALAVSDGTTFEAAWIVTNAGVTRGVATDGRKTVATSSASGNPVADDAGVVPAPGGANGGATAPDPAFLDKFRCGRIVLAYLREQNNVLSGKPSSGPSLSELDGKFGSNDCGRFYVLT